MLVLFWYLALIVTVLLAFGVAGKVLQALAWVVLILVAVVILYAIFFTFKQKGI